MLRLWRDDPQAPWQASLQSTASEEIHRFVDVEQMWAFLIERLGVDGGAPQASGETKREARRQRETDRIRRQNHADPREKNN